MSQPVDPTTTPAWADPHRACRTGFEPDLRGWFADDPRAGASRSRFTAGDLYVDLSKNLITADVLAALVDLAEQVGLAERRDAMFAGEHINVTEDRAVLHTALRLPRDASLIVDGVDVVPQVHEVLDKVYAFADKVRSGEWVGVTGKPIKTVVNIGIGGSDLGPVMVYEALQPYVQAGSELPVRLQHRPDRRGGEDQGPRSRDHAVHRGVQDLHHLGDADQRAAGPGLAA